MRYSYPLCVKKPHSVKNWHESEFRKSIAAHEHLHKVQINYDVFYKPTPREIDPDTGTWIDETGTWVVSFEDEEEQAYFAVLFPGLY